MEHHLKKIGFFGGTFDPIHFGHINLVIELLEAHHLDEVLFCPANFSPHKEDSPIKASSKQRKEMIAIAIESIASFSLLDLELDRKGPSFTIDTLRHLQKMRPHEELHLILGEDQLPGIDRWKDIEELIQMATPLIGSRFGDFFINIPGISSGSAKLLHKGMTKIPLMDISSTYLRERLKKQRYCGHLIPPKVLDYIYQHQIY